MPRPRKAPRLWLRPAKEDRAETWVVLDRGRQFGTGFGVEQEAQATEFLKHYVMKTYGRPDGWKNPIGDRVKPGTLLSGDGLIYFASTNEVENYPIKIGFSTHATLRVRLHAIQVGNPYRIAALATVAGNQRDEQELHDLFGYARLRGEWFERAPDLLEFIQSLPRQQLNVVGPR